MMEKMLNKLVLGAVMTRPAAFFDWLYRRDWYGDMMREWAFGLKIAPGAHVLELGCGPGNLSMDMAARGWRVTGMDRSEKMLQRARRLAAKPAAEKVEFVQGDALDLPFDAETFDAVLSASLVNLVADRPAMLGGIARVLKPGGAVSLLFPTPGFDDALAQAQAAKRGIGGLSRSALLLWARSAPKLDPAVLMGELTDAGFEAVRETTVFGGGVALVSGTAIKAA